MTVQKLNIDAFMQYAASARLGASGGKSVIHLADGNTMRTTAWLKLGKRNDGFRAKNLETRQQLLAALSDEFNGIENLPKSVRKALNIGAFKLEDGVVTSCRPLTARRIEKITAAVKAARVARTTENTVVDNLTSAVVSSFKNKKLPEHTKNALVAKFGKTPSKIRKKMEELVKTNQKLAKCLKPTPMSMAQMDEFKSLVKASTKETFLKAMESNVPFGFAGDCLRVGGNAKMFAHTTINGRHVPPNAKCDDAILDLFQKSNFPGGFTPHTVGNATNPNNTTNPNVAFFGQLVSVVPQSNPNKEAIMKLVTSQLGLQGLNGDLGYHGILMNSEQQFKDWGFGNIGDIMSETDMQASVFAPGPDAAGSRDISLQDNAIVLTQRTHFGPQIFSLDGETISIAGGNNAVDIPVYEVTKTIRIPLDQPKLNPGEMPKYTCDVSVATANEDSIKERLQDSPCGFGKPITLTLPEEGAYVEKTVMTASDVDSPALNTLTFGGDPIDDLGNGLGYVDTELRRNQTFEIGGQLLAKKNNDTTDQLNAALVDAFTAKDARTGETKTDWAALRLLNVIFKKGLNYPDNERSLMGNEVGKLTFPFVMGGANLSADHGCKLRRLENGHFAVTFRHRNEGMKLYDKINGENEETYEKKETNNTDETKNVDFYEYHYSLEFYVDEQGSAHVSVLENPQVTWQIGNDFKREQPD